MLVERLALKVLCRCKGVMLAYGHTVKHGAVKEPSHEPAEQHDDIDVGFSNLRAEV